MDGLSWRYKAIVKCTSYQGAKMLYCSGQVVEIGDRVLIEHRKANGVVEHIIESNAALIEWGLEPNGEFGVLIKAAPFGLVFWQIEDCHDPIIFIGRSE